MHTLPKPKYFFIKFSLLLFFICLMSGSVLGQETLVKYQFNYSLVPDSGEIGSPSITKASSIDFSNYYGNPKSSLDTRRDNKSIELTISTVGYKNIKVEWEGGFWYGSSNGTHQWLLSADSGSGYGGTLYTQNCQEDQWDLVSYLLSSSFDDNSNVKIKITSNVNSNKNFSRYVYLDNLKITGEPTSSHRVSLSVGSNSINENGGSANITASIPSAYTDDITVNLTYSGGSASDYSAANQIVIPAGATSASISFTAIDNDTNDGDKDVLVEVSSVSSPGIEYGTQEQTITITDDDAPSTASIEINTQDASVGTTPDDLVQNVLVTGCLIADNVTFSGNANQIGYFNQGDSDFPFAEGIILSTGNVANAIGPNDETATSRGFDGSGDSDLTSIAGQTTNDASVLEFDFKPAGDVLQFRYVFASDEYSEYACGSFNDVFAFLLSGPGINDGSQSENIALLDDGVTPVSINNVHGYRRSNTTGKYVVDENGYYQDYSGTRYHYEYSWVDDNSCPPVNSHLYVDNSSRESIVYSSGRIKTVYKTAGAYDIEYDGRTVVLTATFTGVTPCEWYHIKLAIADVADDAYDSAVFLEAKSFKSNEITVDNMIGSIEGNQDVMYEGCEGSFMRFIRSEDYDIDEEINFAINITGTANNEAGDSQDYVYTEADGTIIGDGVFPTTITIPAGQDYVDYHYKALDEDVVEDDETITFRIDRCPCDGSEYYEKTVTIINSPKVSAVASAAIKCEGAGNPTATITVQLIDGISSANYLYSFDGGVSFDTSNVKNITSSLPDGSDLVGKTYDIIVKDLFSCSHNTLNLSTTIPEIQPISANAGGDRSMCTGHGIQLLGSGGVYYEWTCSTAGIVSSHLSDPNVQNPWIADDIPAGTYEFTLKVQDQPGAVPICSDQESMTLTVLPSPIVNSVFAGKYELCSGEETSLQANVNMPVSYVWNPSSGLDDYENSNPIFSADVTSEESRSFTLTVKASNGCTTVANLEKAIAVFPNPSISLLDATSNFCADGNNGEIHIEATGGTPNMDSPYYNYVWSHDSSLNSPDATTLGVDSYTITVTDAKACTDTQTYNVTAQPTPKGIFTE